MTMALDTLTGMDAPTADALRTAGIVDAAALSTVDDADALAARATLDATRVTAWRDEARTAAEALLTSAGYDAPLDVARADTDELADRTKLPRESARALQHVAVATLLKDAGVADVPLLADDRGALAEKLGLDVPTLDRLAPGERVVLRDDSNLARVLRASGVFNEVMIVTARVNEDAAALLARAPGDAVLLKERAVLAPFRIGGTSHEGLPIYKAKPAGSAAPSEFRVRVVDIKDRALADEEKPKGFLSRFRRKK